MLHRPALLPAFLLALASLLVLAPRASSQTPSAEEPASQEGPQVDAYKPLGPLLFPIYQHYLQTADGTEVENYLYLYTRTFNRRDGSRSSFLFPLYYSSSKPRPPQETLSLFPLLFFHRESETESYNYSFPFYFEHSSPGEFLRLVVPFWLHTKKKDVSRYRILPPLFRYSVEPQRPEALPREPPSLHASEARIHSTRFGLPYLLELWESRMGPETTAVTALNLFNWREETRGGLPLFRSSWTGQGDNAQGSTRLFPIYWDIRDPGGVFHALLPLYAYARGHSGSDLFLPALLSRYGAGKDGETRLDLLFPLWHYAATEESYSAYSFPLVSLSENRPQNRLWSLLILYHASKAQNGKHTYSFLYPLSNFENEPDGSGGDNWFFPYIETYDSAELYRFLLPVYGEYQTLSGGKTDWSIRVGLPGYFSTGTKKDYFSMFFPLYWASRTGARGWRMVLPFYYDSYAATSRGIHVVPFFSYRSFPSRKQMFFLGPLYIHEDFFDYRRQPSGTAHHVLWPLIAVENDRDGYLYRFAPFFWFDSHGDTRELLLTPFYYVVDGPRGRQRYFLPFYGHYERDRLTRDLYAFASYIHTTETDEDGAVVRTRHDALWSLASYQKDRRTGATHTHVLPLAYWDTKTPSEDRTIAGPFYYSHRIDDADKTYHLDLVLGNLFYSRKVETREAAATPSVAGSPSPGETAARDSALGSSSLFPLTEERPRERPLAASETYREWGVLWPLSRAYRSADGSSGSWILPVYFHSRSDVSRKSALFPFLYLQDDTGPYGLNFFRYLFLFDRETWRGGHRWSVGQVLLDWKNDTATASRRLRILYPLLEYNWDPGGYTFEFTPLCHFSSRKETVENRIFPFYWQGKTVRQRVDGSTEVEKSHFFLFPLLGKVARQTYTDYFGLFPFFHVRTSADALSFELWPAFFWRDEPALFAVRLWPLHADESRVNAGEFWVSRFLFLSKRFETENGFRYRLDPFLFRLSRSPESFGIASLFELLAYDRAGESSSFRALPFIFAASSPDASHVVSFPFYYGRDYGKENINYIDPWRFLFLGNHLEGADGERHNSLLWKLFEHTDNPNRPQYSETRVLQWLFIDRTTETSRTWALSPFFGYYRNEKDDETQYSFLLSLYNSRSIGNYTTHRLFYFLEF